MARGDPAVGKEKTEETDRPVASRVSRQARGQVRIDAILAAAAAAIAKGGLAGVTMHALARQARTSIGSLYHFFPDRDAVLDALYERHRIAIRQITRQFDEIPSTTWLELSAAATIERLIIPYVEYMQRNVDYLPLRHSRTSVQAYKADDADFLRVIRHVIDIRLPGTDRTERQIYAAVLQAAAAGIVQVGFQTDPLHAEAHLREIPRVLAAYLADIEASVRRRRKARSQKSPA